MKAYQASRFGHDFSTERSGIESGGSFGILGWLMPH